MFGDIYEPVGDNIRLDSSEIEPLTARQNCRRKLVNLCRCKNKLYVFGRFFERFEERVECFDCEHMNLVDDIYTVFRLRRSKIRLVAKHSNIVYASVRCSVYLHNVKHRAAVYSFAYFTFIARVAVDGMQTVERLRKNFCARGLAGSAGSGKKVRMRSAVLPQLRQKRIRNLRLPDNVGKNLRPPLSI